MLKIKFLKAHNGDSIIISYVLYKKYISSEPFSGRNRCLNFPKESECEKYNSKIKRDTD